MNGHVERLKAWPPGSKSSTVRDVLVQAEKLHHAANVVQPRRYFVCRPLQLSGLHLNGEGGEEGEGRTGNRCSLMEAILPKREIISVLFFRFVKQKPVKR